MEPELRVITDQVLVLGLDHLYRTAMKGHESDELLRCARVVARRLGVEPAAVPIEGYYSETPALSEYFCLVRCLQKEKSASRRVLEGLREFLRLEEVTSAPLFGISFPDQDSLLPQPCDPLYFALHSLPTSEYSVETLAPLAREVAIRSGDASLVGLAAYTGDGALITALRETAVLYARVQFIGIFGQPEVVYRWEVDPELARRAERFVRNFNDLFDDSVPLPSEANASIYWEAWKDNKVHGRCVRIAYDPDRRPDHNYHWAVYQARDGRYHVEDFWAERLWTTSYYSGHQVFPQHP